MALVAGRKATLTGTESKTQKKISINRIVENDEIHSLDTMKIISFKV